MKQTAVEFIFEELENRENGSYSFTMEQIYNKAKEMEENLQLEMVHKFAFDYTYNYKGEKTIYEWITEWFEGYKKLEEKHKKPIARLSATNIMENVLLEDSSRFNFGYESMQVKMYSEEEVENILIEYVKTNPTKPYRVISWFNKFKKK